MLITFVWNLLKLMPYSLKFVILLIKLLSDLSILLSSIPIYLIYVLLGENPLSNSQNLHFTEKCSTDNLFCKIQWLYNSPFRKIKVIKFFDLVSIGNCIFIKNELFANLTLYLAICITYLLVDIITEQDMLWMAS